MASHHHHHHHHLCHQPPLPTLTCYCQSFYAPYTPFNHHPPPPPDPHLHYPHHPQQPQDTHPHPPTPPSHPHHPRFEERHFQEEKQTRQTVSSLTRRIAALESALLRRFSSLPQSLRDAAARTIQTHFRAFLLRRSRTLRQLKELSSIKLTLTILKSSVSGKTHFDYNLVYHEAAILLRKLDTIQGGDPMIRDGKSSIKREVNNFLIFIDGICLERSQLSSRVNVRYGRNSVKSRVSSSERKTEKVKCRGLDRVKEDKLKGLLKKIDLLEEELEKEESDTTEHRPNIRKHSVSRKISGGLAKLNGPTQSNVKKSVSFADDGKLYKLVRRNRETSSDEDWDDALVKDNLVDARELEDDLCPDVEEMGVSSKEPEDDDEEEAHSEDEDSHASSVGEKDFRSYPISEGDLVRIRHNQGESDTFVFSAPLPVKMETRGNLTETRKK